jgi:transposase
MARDRSSAYADGARQGAPAATQVADRFHLRQNLREALDQVFSMHSQGLDAVNGLVHQQPIPLPNGAMAVPVPPHDSPLPTQQRARQRQARRQALHTTEVEAQQLTQLQAQAPEVAEAIDLAQDFTQMVRQRQPESLDPWLQRASTSTVGAIQRFAKGLYEDYDAIKAGVTLPWSSSPVEGHINRLKMVKRQMFGRAHLDLRSRRFLWAPRAGQAQAPGGRALAPVPAAAEAA